MRSSLYTARDLAPAELHAAALSGELYAVGDAWASLATPDVPELRIASLVARLPAPSAVVDRRSAAWVWGARSRPPLRAHFAVRGTVLGPGVDLRETPLPAHDVVRLGGLAIVTPARTVIDLLRVPGPLEPCDADAVHWLLTLGQVSADGVRERIEAGRRVPYGRGALRKLAAVVSRR